MPSGAPEVLSSFPVSPGAAAGWPLFAMLALGTLLEPPLLAFAQGRRARPMMLLGLCGMGVCCLLAALAPSFPVLLAALLLYGPASGLGLQLSEAALMTERPDDREGTLARWMLSGLVGDLLAPVAVAASVALGWGLRGALAAAGMLALLQTAAVWRAHASIALDADDEEEAVPVRAALSEALRTRPLIAWSLVALSCSLLDELLVSFGALHLEVNLGATPADRATGFAAWVMGGVLGTVALERLGGRVRPSTLMMVAGVGSAAGYGAWLIAPGPAWAAAALGLTGLFTAAHYPLVTARAYAALPNRPNIVAAIASLVGILDLLPPLLIGWIADRFGVLTAVAVLGVQPVIILVAAIVAAAPRPRAPLSR